MSGRPETGLPSEWTRMMDRHLEEVQQRAPDQDPSRVRPIPPWPGRPGKGRGGDA